MIGRSARRSQAPLLNDALAAIDGDGRITSPLARRLLRAGAAFDHNDTEAARTEVGLAIASLARVLCLSADDVRRMTMPTTARAAREGIRGFLRN